MVKAVKVPDNEAVIIRGKQDMLMQGRPVHEPGPEDVLLKIEYCGICGTDLHLYAHNVVGFWTLKTPCVLGHEASATVIEAGSKVQDLKPGDRVAMEPAAYCGKCLHCNAGSNNLCYMNTTEWLEPEGFFQNYTIYPSYLCHRLPDNVTLEEGALVEPLACALRGVLRIKIKAGEDILILGSGPIGLLSAQACKSYGAHKIVMTDINPKRLDIALKAKCANETYLIEKDKDQATQVKEIEKLFGRRPDVTLDCTGMEPCMNLAIDVTKRGGRVGLVGLTGGKIAVPLTIASMKEIDLIATAKYDTTDFRLAIKMLQNKVIDAIALVSHKMELNQFQQAFDMLNKGEGVKILLKC